MGIWGGKGGSSGSYLPSRGSLVLPNPGPTLYVPRTLNNAPGVLGLTILPTGETLQPITVGTGRSWSAIVGMSASQGGLLLAYTSTDDALWHLTPGANPYTITLNGLTTSAIPANASVTYIQNALWALGLNYAIVNVYSSSGIITIMTGSLGRPTIASGDATITGSLASNIFVITDQLNDLIFAVGPVVTTYAGMYVALNTYAGRIHALGWWGDTSGGAGSHAYPYLNQWGSAPFDVGSAPQFHGNGLSVLQLVPPTVDAFASNAASTLAVGTYYYVATAVNLAGVETVIGPEVAITTTNADPSVQLATQQCWGNAQPNFYRGTVSGGPYTLIGAGTGQPGPYGTLGAGIGLLDNGLAGGGVNPPTAPTPAPVLLQGWKGEPGTNPKLVVKDVFGSTWFSVSAHGQITTTLAQIGQQVAFAPITASFGTGSMPANTWTAFTAGPTITLPNDGFTYRVKLHFSQVSANTAGNYSVGLFNTGTGAMYAAGQASGTAAGVLFNPDVEAQDVIGAGQTIGVYGRSATVNTTLTIAAATTGALIGQGPCELAAYRVA